MLRIQIGELHAVDVQLVDLERIDRLQSILPAAFLDRHVVLVLGLGMAAVQIADGPVHLEVGDQLAMDDFPPLDARAQLGDREDRRIGESVLNERQPQEIEPESERMEVGLLEPNRVADELAVQFALHVGAQRPIDDQTGKGNSRSNAPAPAAIQG